MSSQIEPGLGLGEPEPLPDDFVAARWALTPSARRALAWKVAVAVPVVALLLTALVAPGAFGAAVEACGGG